MADFIRNMNWELLKKQKDTLVKLADESSNSTCLTKEEQDNLDGIVHLIDALQDWAVDDQGVAEDLVFPNLGEDIKKSEIIGDINMIVSEYGHFTVADVGADYSPSVGTDTKLYNLMETFDMHQGRVFIYDPKNRVEGALEEYDEDYYQLPLSELEYILSLAKKWADINE